MQHLQMIVKNSTTQELYRCTTEAREIAKGLGHLPCDQLTPDGPVLNSWHLI